MKHILFASAISLAAGAAWADGLSDPVIEPEIVIEDTVNSAGGDDWVVIFMTIITIGMAAAK